MTNTTENEAQKGSMGTKVMVVIRDWEAEEMGSCCYLVELYVSVLHYGKVLEFYCTTV